MERSSYRLYAEARLAQQQRELRMERETVDRLEWVVKIYIFIALIGWTGFVVALCAQF